MALSEFSYTLEFIRGVDNNIADAMSRLCRNNMIDQPQEYSEKYILSSITIEKHGRKTNKEQYRRIGEMLNSKIGHFGLEHTLKCFKDLQDTREFQRQHIRYIIDNCPCGQKMSMLESPIHAHGFTTSACTPMECLIKGISLCLYAQLQDGWSYVLLLTLRQLQLQSAL